MTDITLEQRARELLAAAMKAEQAKGYPARLGDDLPHVPQIIAIEVIEAALRLSAGVDGMALRHASVLLGIIDGADKHRDGYLWWPKGRSIDEQNWYAEQGIAQRAQIEEARAAIAIATATTEVCHE